MFKQRIALAFLILSLAAPVFAGEDPAAALREKFPKLTFESISASPVKGVYEVIAGKNVLYFVPETGHMFFGELWTAEGVNLTAQAHANIQKAKFSIFKERLAAAVKIGSGKHEVVEIIDPDCPYCRKMNEYWQKRTDVTRYVFFLPLTSLHPQSEDKVAYILSSSDPGKALSEVEAGVFDTTALPVFVRNDARIRTHADLVAKSGIDGTPAYYIDGVYVGGANVAAIEKIIGKEETSK